MARRTSRAISSILRGLSDQTQALSDLLLAEQRQATIHQLFSAAREQIRVATHRELTDRELADTLGQTLLQARVTWKLADQRLAAVCHQPGFWPPADSLWGQLLRVSIRTNSTAVLDPMLAMVDPFLQAVERLAMELQRETMRTPELPDSRCPPSAQNQSQQSDHADFDTFLQAHDPRGRARHGVYFTPRPLAAYIVNEIDRALISEFHLPHGLADTTCWAETPFARELGKIPSAYRDLPFVRILDPAAGAGVFLAAVIDRVFTTWKGMPLATVSTAEERNQSWNDYVARFLLPRLSAMDVLLPACVVGWIRIAEQLAITGYRFESAVSIPIALGDSLALPVAERTESIPVDLTNSAPVTVVLGNPPFSALTTSSNPWIDELLRTAKLNQRHVGGFYEVDGSSLGERKLWLHDDYVKFLRLAQWKIECAGCGIVGVVTSHGYLDNLTFRGVRQSLLNTFSRISVLDLHGNRKKREVSPSGKPDENVFGIDQGVAIGLLRRTVDATPRQVNRGDLWGSRGDKLAALQTGEPDPDWQTISPHSPHYLFTVDRRKASSHDYLLGFPLHEVMPVYSAAAVTARDSFSVAFTADELLDRMRIFSGEESSDDELRRRYFNRTRSGRYPAGDTRGWKLSRAREQARSAGDPRAFLRRCLYRPFDWRWVLWADWMIDWPRSEIMRHLLSGQNLALVTRRQMIPDQPANYFYVADSIVIDGLIRSDNRGSESFFPLYLMDQQDGTSNKVPNFDRQFWQLCQQPFSPDQLPAPEDVFHMIYAQFHSSLYRDRYHAELCLGFPRVFVPRDPHLFRSLVDYGRQLVDAHLLRLPKSASAVTAGGMMLPGSSLKPIPNQDYPHFSHGQLSVTEDWCLEDIPVSTWEFQIGGYQVCRKWLRDRRGRTLSPQEASQFVQIVDAVTDTQRVMKDIDAAILAAGGWPDAFVGRTN